MGRIVILSDIHLSPTHGFFWENWCLARDFANRAAADAVIVNGDLTINGPDSDEEVKFAALAIKRLRGPVLPLPGNHDIGDEPPGQDPDQIVNTQRLARWDSSFGADRWMMDTEGWRLIGVNAQLFGSGLRREGEQNRWLEEQLVAATGRFVALFLHKPLFLEDLNEGPASAACIVPLARASLVDRLHRRGVSLVVSGHLHEYRDRTFNGLRHLWVPAVAFAAPQSHGGDGRCGLTVLDFSQRGVEITIERPQGMVSHDLAAIKGHGRYPFLRDMPPSPIVLTD
jgi:3',5'-cyclic AMP phosphodiesterase CpdA